MDFCPRAPGDSDLMKPLLLDRKITDKYSMPAVRFSVPTKNVGIPLQ